MELKLTLRLLTNGERIFGPGVAELLERVQEHHSLRSAAASMEMAYSKAWRIVRAAEEGMGCKLLSSSTGGRHGGGAFSGKDPTKVDRSAAYMARYMAKNLVAAGLATKVQVQLAYAIGVAQPVSLRVDSYGTGKISDEKMTELLRETCDMTPAGIIRKLDLRRPIYADTAANGHFGIESRPWEQTDLADKLRQLSGI